MIRNNISDDMVNIMLRQKGAISIKTSPAHINIAKFDLGEDQRVIYMYEVKEEEIWLQRISPYPMMIGKIYNEQQIVDIIDMDLKKFKAAYESSNFTQFIEVANFVASFDKEIENLFLTRNVSKEDLDEIEAEMKRLHQLICKTTENSPVLQQK